MVRKRLTEVAQLLQVYCRLAELNYIGAITSIPDIRAGNGEFRSKEEFYSFWRAYEGWNS